MPTNTVMSVQGATVIESRVLRFRYVQRLLSRFWAPALLVLQTPFVFAATGESAEKAQVPETASTVAIERLRLSDTLADFGEERADPFALIEAAKIRKTLPPPLNEATSASAGGRTWQTLLTQASQLSESNPTARSLIAEVRRLKVRNIDVIPSDIKLLHKNVAQNAADRAEVQFKAGEIAVVYVRPIPPVNLDLFVYDNLNNLICTGGSGHESECRWRPRHDGSYLIDVHNNNSAQVEYDLAINRDIVPR